MSVEEKSRIGLDTSSGPFVPWLQRTTIPCSFNKAQLDAKQAFPRTVLVISQRNPTMLLVAACYSRHSDKVELATTPELIRVLTLFLRFPITIITQFLDRFGTTRSAWQEMAQLRTNRYQCPSLSNRRGRSIVSVQFLKFRTWMSISASRPTLWIHGHLQDS